MEIREEHRKIIDALYDTWSNDEKRRKESEEFLKDLEKDENILIYLLDICTYNNVHINVRKLAIMYSKNLISLYWNCKNEFQIKSDIKKIVKDKIIVLLNDSNNINILYKEYCILLKKIARYELVHNFPELLECLLNNINIHRNNLNNLYIYLYLLYKILREQYSKKLFKDKKQTFDISQTVINILEPFWNNNINIYYKNSIENPCIYNDEYNCEKCYDIFCIMQQYEESLSFNYVENCIKKEDNNNNSLLTYSCIEGLEKNIFLNSKVCSIGSTLIKANTLKYDQNRNKKIEILKFLDSILINLIINRKDIIKSGIFPTNINEKNGKNEQNEQKTNGDENKNNNSNICESGDRAIGFFEQFFFESLVNKIVYFLKYVNKNSQIYYMSYLKFLLKSFFLMVEFHSEFHMYLKKEIIEKFICLFLKKNINIKTYNNEYDTKFIDIINLCITIIKSLFYHFCLNQYNLIKQKTVRENYVNVKNIMNNKNTVKLESYYENSLGNKIINNIMTNINKPVENNNISNIFCSNTDFTLKNILGYIRGEVKETLKNDDFILLNNEKAIEIFDFMRIYCINLSPEHIIDITLNVKDDYEIEENIFYSNGKNCIIQLTHEPFFLVIFNHFFEPLINSFHNYAHFLRTAPQNLKNVQNPIYSEQVIQLDGYLNVYYILYPSFHKKIKNEHILCMIQFFIDFIKIQLTHPLISYRICLIIKVWIKNYKAAFPFVDDVIILIYENMRLLYSQLSQKHNSLLWFQEISQNEKNILPSNHYGLKSSNFIPLLFFKFISLFKYIFKYEYVYKRYDQINEFLVEALVSILSKIMYPKNSQKILKIMSHIIFINNKQKDITIFKENYNFFLNLYINSNTLIREYILDILIKILNKNYDEKLEYMGSENKNENIGGSINLYYQMSEQTKNIYNENNKINKEVICDENILFYFSFDIIFYTISAKVGEYNKRYENSENLNFGEDITYKYKESINNIIYMKNEHINYNILNIIEINLNIDKNIGDHLYSLWLCILKLTSKYFNKKNENIIKTISSLYICITRYVEIYFENLKNANTLFLFDLNNTCFDIIIEYLCFFINNETYNYYLTYEAFSKNVITNELLKNSLLNILQNILTIKSNQIYDEERIEKGIYILHICASLYRNYIKTEIPSIFINIVNFIVIYFLKIIIKYFNKLFNNDQFGNKNKQLVTKNLIYYQNQENVSNFGNTSLYSNSFITIENHNEFFIRENKPHNEQINEFLQNYKEKQRTNIHENIINYDRDEIFFSNFTIYQNNIKQILNVKYLNEYNITTTFQEYNFYTIKEDNYNYICNNSILPLVATMSIYEPNFLNYILISFISYFGINISIFLSAIYEHFKYIHNKNITMSSLIFIYMLNQNYIFRNFSAIFVFQNFSNILSIDKFEQFVYGKNKSAHLFISEKNDSIVIIIELTKLINNILNTNKDIYIEKKHILHLTTATSNLIGNKIYNSYNYNTTMRAILKYDEFTDLCDKIMDAILLYILDSGDPEKKNRNQIILNYLKENIDGMNIALINMCKKYGIRF
ncbi:conserved Plasmodium protein, unknown function [Plasmodium berghei]|uniref:Importin N-terminal domain-containing protein n=2 Tax=Plasmodium berghei TaxID=5821 RepID=A0A509AMS1_PLABA|nr:conserved Plasmodium protein, unknown function [Plasmodium berghei ANKA]SCL94360.1 conserved Plasmodium protein, unknown function [Plasmodium berghei]SCM16000.1 conserved Plasmodium protein, unknown function [Plasmodium berghei]SCM17796.1 conserved Plasmodium protein, unknown function [Plasmodium berghei]SCN26038.1 conserved Plasmodium protein, unknown function [Plasmodium berghei]VUC56123.1 conserved Plasmodium protein, unknown function [Plasmodium berghei ANKA]|eukprot:XP_034421925.1 conserved Plasmodium protein, unknown function [Plasmodium berghei ANKA]